MATRLPSAADLGATPGVTGERAIGNPDVSGVARGGAALAQAGQQAGKGLVDLGKAVGDVQLDKARYDYATAHAQFLSGVTDLESSLQHDQDYATLPKRYEDGVTKLRDQAAERIGMPNMRSRFIELSEPAIATGRAKVTQQAFKTEGDAQVAYVQAQGDKFINQGTANPSDHTLQPKLVDSYGQLVDGLAGRGYITPEAALKAKQDWAHKYAIADGVARSQTDPQGVINDLRAKPSSPEQIDNRIMQVEGAGRDPRSSAVGGFIDKTWLNLIRGSHPELADRSDSDILALRADRGLRQEMTGRYREQNAAVLTRNGIEASSGNLYLAHFLGPQGAVAVAKAAPGTPVADVLAGAVGKDMAAKMIAANPTILQGQTAGSVSQWSADKMGGVGPGGGHIYDLLRPDQRSMLLFHAQNAIEQHHVVDMTNFKVRVSDSESEAARTGDVTNPIGQEEFIARAGAIDGPKAYANYQANLQLGKDVARVATLGPEQQNALINSYEPKPGSDGYSNSAARHDALVTAAKKVDKEKQDDPAQFAMTRLPATRAAYRTFADASDDDARAAAARKYAATTLLEQDQVGVDPDRQRIVSKDYIKRLDYKLTHPAQAGGSVDVVRTIDAEAQLWGEYWPKVYRELAPEIAPVARVIGSGIAPAPARLLSELAPLNLSAILKDQDADKAASIKAKVLEAFKPLRDSFGGNEGADKVFEDFRSQGEKLASHYLARGVEANATDAAAHAFKDLAGDKYDFAKTFRIPKDLPGITSDEVKLGATIAQRMIARPSLPQGSLLDQARAQYPALQKYDVKYKENFGGGTERLESWPAGELGTPERPRPKEFGAGDFGVEIYDKQATSKDVAGDIVSHHLVNVDPKVKAAYTEFTGSLQPWQNDILKEQYQHALKSDGEKRPFDVWKQQSGLPAYFRGYTFQQWSPQDVQRMYTPEQLKRLDGVVSHLTAGSNAMPFDIAPARDTFGGLRPEYLKAATAATYARDGAWATAPDESGLLFTYRDEAVRRADGKPLILSWQQLGELGKQDQLGYGKPYDDGVSALPKGAR